MPSGVALISGASSGIGAIYADRLAHRGYDLVLVARNRRRLDIVSAEIARRTGRKIEVLAADLTEPADLAMVEQVLRTNSRITMLVNNAGIGATAPLLGSEVDKMSQMIALNVGALTRLTYAAAPAFVARGVGTIINVASFVAVHPEILNGVYAGTKAFVLAFSRSLNHGAVRQGRPRPGGASRRHRHRFLGYRRHAGRAPSRRVGHAGWRDGRCGAGGA